MADFVFGPVEIHRLEPHTLVIDGCGHAALAEAGAVREGTLRRSFLRDDQYLDQALWSILKDDWLQAKAVWGEKVH